MDASEHPLSKIVAEVAAGADWAIGYGRSLRAPNDNDFYVEVTALTPGGALCCDCLGDHIVIYLSTEKTTLDVSVADPKWQDKVREELYRIKNTSEK